MEDLYTTYRKHHGDQRTIRKDTIWKANAASGQSSAMPCQSLIIQQLTRLCALEEIGVVATLSKLHDNVE